MAKVGMKYPVFARIESEIAGQPITYGEGFFIAEAISANVDLERADARLYGDDTLQERDNSIVGGSESLNVTRLPLEMKMKLLGMEYNEESKEYDQTGEPSPYGGHGYLSEYREKGKTKYEAIWFHKVQFSQNSFSDQTKGQQLEYNTPTITGEIMGVNIDNSGKTKFFKQKDFATEAEALSWLKQLANITEPAKNAEPAEV